MLAVSNVSKSYGIKPVLAKVSFTLKKGQRLGLVGPNGCGKTTLLKIIAGEEVADLGSIRTTPAHLRISYLSQSIQYGEKETIGQYLDRFRVNQRDLSLLVEEYARQMARDPHNPQLHEQYDVALNLLASVADLPDQSQVVLKSLGLDLFNATTPVKFLSGGQKTRLALAGVLMSQPQLLYLDEPTNHLDIDMLEWLEGWLTNHDFSVLVVSHDRAFLDNVTNGILELDPLTHRVKQYPGNYSAYLEQKETERAHQLDAYLQQQEEINQLQAAAAHIRGISRFKKGGKADTGDKFARGFFANRSKGTIGRAKHIEQRIDRLLTEDRVEKPARFWQMKIEFDKVQPTGRDVLVMEDLAIGYVPGEPLATSINLVLRFGQRVALIGRNGTGKTTLLRTLIGNLAPLAGRIRIGTNVKLGHMAQEQENLSPQDTPLTAILRILPTSETEARSLLSKYLFKGDDVFTPVVNMSFGERSRLSLACLAADGCNLLLLDEPVNHLDIPARVRFEEALRSYEGTILAVVHDRYFIQAFATAIWEFDHGSVREIA